jgi:hypothetical protein
VLYSASSALVNHSVATTTGTAASVPASTAETPVQPLAWQCVVVMLRCLQQFANAVPVAFKPRLRELVAGGAELAACMQSRSLGRTYAPSLGREVDLAGFAPGGPLVVRYQTQTQAQAEAEADAQVGAEDADGEEGEEQAGYQESGGYADRRCKKRKWAATAGVQEVLQVLRVAALSDQVDLRSVPVMEIAQSGALVVAGDAYSRIQKQQDSTGTGTGTGTSTSTSTSTSTVLVIVQLRPEQADALFRRSAGGEEKEEEGSDQDGAKGTFGTTGDQEEGGECQKADGAVSCVLTKDSEEEQETPPLYQNQTCIPGAAPSIPVPVPRARVGSDAALSARETQVAGTSMNIDAGEEKELLEEPSAASDEFFELEITQ